MSFKSLLFEMWQSGTHVVGASVLISGAVAAFIYIWCAVSDWLACEGTWARCTKCGGRTRREAIR